MERDTGMEAETYLVTPEVQHLVSTELRQVRLFTAINKHGTVFLWPVSSPRRQRPYPPDRRHRSPVRGAGQNPWVKMHWEPDLGGYEMQRAKGDLGEPQWPDKSLRDLIELAFRHHLIDRPDHPVIRELAGEI